MPGRKPNIIYILSDEHRGQAMGHAGDQNLKTPAMDRMAAEGVSFSRAYSNCPICTPSRGTIFSGRHAHSGPVSGFFDVYKATAPSIATELRAGGYHTAYIGKWHCGVVRDQLPEVFRGLPADMGTPATRTPEYHRAGFQDWAAFEVINAPFDSFVYRGNDTDPTPLPRYQTDALTDLAIDYIRDYRRSEPLFLVLSVEPPHFPLEVPEQWKRLDPRHIVVRPNFGIQSDFFPHAPAIPHDRLRTILANYYACTENLDWNIGRLMETIEACKGFADETLTVYISDHGDYVGSHGLDTTKVQHHEESVRIPAIFHWPDGIAPARFGAAQRAGTAHAESGSGDTAVRAEGSGEVEATKAEPAQPLFGLVDLFATTLDLVGLPVPVHNQGASFAPFLRGEHFPGPESVLLEMVNNPRWNLRFLDWRGIVTCRYKYAFCETGREELFDLDADPYELTNIADTEPDLRASMRERLLDLLAETREPYFDVLIEHGVPAEGPVTDIADPSGPLRDIVWKGGLT